MDPAKPIWRNNGLLAVLILAAAVTVVAVSMYSPAPDVEIHAEYYHNKTSDVTTYEFTIKNLTDRTIAIDRDGFSKGGTRLHGDSDLPLMLLPYATGAFSATMPGEVDPSDRLTYSHDLLFKLV